MTWKRGFLMEGYTNYDEFIDELLLWGDMAVYGETKERDVWEAFLQMWEKSRQGVAKEAFSPFLYLALSAKLSIDEAMFLASVLYAGIKGGEENTFTYSFWERFVKKCERSFSKAELFFHASPVLFQWKIKSESGEACIQLVPQVFLFLRRGILAEQKIPGMYWYNRSISNLPFLGSSICVYEQMQSCLKSIGGKKLFYLHGRKGSGRKLNYAYLAASMGKRLAVAEYETLSSKQHLQEILVECILHNGILAVEMPKKEASDFSLVLDWMEEENLFFLGEGEILSLDKRKDRQYLSFHIDTQRVLGDKELYRRMADEYHWDREETRNSLLGRYVFLPGKMRDVLEFAKAYALSRGQDCIAEPDLKQAVIHSNGHSLQKYAKKVEGIYTMKDLILPSKQKQKIMHICNRIKNKKYVYEEWGMSEKSPYGNGVSVVFAGPPGTGKTMAAQVVASELGMELYRVELPAVVDKYIGETEKKLNRIFEEAEKSMAILFFDEADVLFSKRTEIKESNDKYNNMEIAFLLQKMEEHEGASILATNYLQNFDEAFRRRVSDIVDFPLPDAASREKMWQNLIPAHLPVSDEMDYTFLANQFQMTGSMIKNVLIYSSFLAAESAGQMLTMELALQGIAHELEKSGKKLGREDYGEYYDF